MTDSDVIDLERAAWQALSTSGDAARAFYREHLADEVLMLLPGGLVIDDRATALDSMSGQPWDTFELADERAIRLSDDTTTVSYRATARRHDTTYAALMTSTWVRTDEGWRMALHQQTPV
jgi:hypothetical protein